MPAQLMTCSDSLARRTVCRLYGQLLITKPLDSFCLYLVLSPSWLWVSSGLQKGLFPYLGCPSLHPWRDKGRRRLSVFITHQRARCVWELWLLCCCCGGETKIKVWLWLNLDLKRHCAFFFFFSQSTPQGQSGHYKAMKHLQSTSGGVVIWFSAILISNRIFWKETFCGIHSLALLTSVRQEHTTPVVYVH